MNIYDYMEDWDDENLSNFEWNEQMEEAVQLYNQEYGTDHMPRSAVKRYISWKAEKLEQDQ